MLTKVADAPTMHAAAQALLKLYRHSTRQRAAVVMTSLAMLGYCCACMSQTASSSFTITVSTNQVLVPVVALTSAFGPIWGALPAKSFRLFQDGKEQRIDSIQTVTVAPEDVNFRDNLGEHEEWSSVPNGRWSSADITGTPPTIGYLHYLISYVPPPSPPGSCHKIRVTVRRADTRLLFRDQYCNVDHSSSDPLRGTVEATKLEAESKSRVNGGIHVYARANAFYMSSQGARVRIDCDFPLRDVTPRKWSEGALPFNIEIVAYDLSGKVIARRSDQYAGDPEFKRLARWYDLRQAGALFSPSRYEAELNLPVGSYTILITVDHGNSFGTSHISLAVKRLNPDRFGISSIALCRRARKVNSQREPGKIVSLMSDGYEFTPTGDTRFAENKPVIAYFELYPPANVLQKSGPDLQLQLRVTSADTDVVLLQTNLSAARWGRNDGRIPIAMKPDIGKLSPGNYLFQIRASDSGVAVTQWQATDFSIGVGRVPQVSHTKYPNH